jgi:hypothetical protein
VEILFVSSAMVIFTHVFIPSLIMKDVNKIKLKLADSIRAFNNSVKKNRGNAAANYEHSSESFSAASYLFVSTRLAQQWSDLREAQIIAQFRTPWPKQSYQRESNVSKSYSKKYTALVRSASVIAIFFLTNLLNIPPAFQDMVIQMTATTTIGYTFLLHIQLYELYPVLVILPTLLLVVVIHFLVQSGRAGARIRLQRMFGIDKSEKVEPLDKSAAAASVSVSVAITSDAGADSGDSESSSEEEDGSEDGSSEGSQDGSDRGSQEGSGESGEEEDDIGQLHMPAPVAFVQPKGHMTRQQSTQYGIKVLETLKRRTVMPEGDEGKQRNSSSEGESTATSHPSVPSSQRTSSVHSSARSGSSGSGLSSISYTPSEEAEMFQEEAPDSDAEGEYEDNDEYTPLGEEDPGQHDLDDPDYEDKEAEFADGYGEQQDVEPAEFSGWGEGEQYDNGEEYEEGEYADEDLADDALAEYAAAYEGGADACYGEGSDGDDGYEYDTAGPHHV